MGSRKACASRMSEAIVHMEPVMVRVAMRWTFSRHLAMPSEPRWLLCESSVNVGLNHTSAP